MGLKCNKYTDHEPKHILSKPTQIRHVSTGGSWGDAIRTGTDQMCVCTSPLCSPSLQTLHSTGQWRHLWSGVYFRCLFFIKHLFLSKNKKQICSFYLTNMKCGLCNKDIILFIIIIIHQFVLRSGRYSNVNFYKHYLEDQSADCFQTIK